MNHLYWPEKRLLASALYSMFVYWERSDRDGREGLVRNVPGCVVQCQFITLGTEVALYVNISFLLQLLFIIECLFHSYLPVSTINFYLFLPFMMSLLKPTMLELLCGGVRMHCVMMLQSQSQLPSETRQVSETCEDTDCQTGSRGYVNWRAPAQPRGIQMQKIHNSPASPIWPSNLQFAASDALISCSEPVQYVDGDRVISYILLVKELKYRIVTF